MTVCNDFIDDNIVRKYIIYKYYIDNFEEKDEYVSNKWADAKQIMAILAHTVTYGLVKMKYYCPRCGEEVDEFTFKNHPIFSMGCPKYRTRKKTKGKQYGNQEKHDN